MVLVLWVVVHLPPVHLLVAPQLVGHLLVHFQVGLLVQPQHQQVLRVVPWLLIWEVLPLVVLILVVLQVVLLVPLHLVVPLALHLQVVLLVVHL